MQQSEDDFLRISNLRSELSDCLDDDEIEISPIFPASPILMPGSKMGPVARKCPRSTKFVVEV